LDIDGFRELGGIETVISAEDAKFLGSISGFYEKFASENSNNDRLTVESARAFRRMANIYHLVGEHVQAIQAYQRAIELYGKAVSANPDSVSLFLALAQSRTELGTAYRTNGEFMAARQQFRRAVTDLENNAHASDPALRLELARTLNAIASSGTLLAAAGSPAAVEPRGNRAAGNRLAAKGDRNSGAPSRPATDREATTTGLRAAGVADLRNHQFVRRSISIVDDLIKEQPDNVEYLAVHAKSLSILAAYELFFRFDKGLSTLGQAISEFESLYTQFPDSTEYRYMLAVTYLMPGTDSESDLRDRIDKAQKISTELVTSQPHILEYQQLAAIVNIRSAESAIRSGDPQRALKELATARTLLTDLSDSAPTGRAYRRAQQRVASSYRLLAEEFRRQGDARSALNAIQLSRQLTTPNKRQSD
jgi:tetratricopeptide (TPR) repeat protein